MYSAASARVAGRLGHEVQAEAVVAAGLLEAGQPGRDHVGRDVADQLAAAHQAQRLAVEAGDDRPAHVDVVERLDRRVHRDVARAAGRDQHDLVLLALDDLRQHRGRRREVAGQHALALEDLARRDRGVVVALRHLDLVHVRRLVVGRLVPVRVADEVDAAAGLVADRLARRVVLDHVRAGRDLVLAVHRRVLLVELRRVLLRHRRAQRAARARRPARRRCRARA